MFVLVQYIRISTLPGKEDLLRFGAIFLRCFVFQIPGEVVLAYL
jgi:hypothetical protein